MKIVQEVQSNTRQSWFMLMLMIAGIASNGMAFTALPAISPLIKDTMQLTPSQIGMLMSSFYVGATIMAFVYSIFLSRMRVGLSIFISLLIVGVFLIIAGTRLVLWWMVGFITLAGLGYGILNPVINKGIVAWFSRDLRGTAMSLKQIGFTLGGTLISAVLPFVTIQWGIHTALILTGIFVILIGVIGYQFYQDSPFSHYQDRGKVTWTEIVGILKDRNMMLCNAITMLFNGAQFIFFMYLPLYLMSVFQYDPIRAGFMLSLSTIGAALGRIGWGLLSDFVFRGRRKTVLILISFCSFVLGLILAWVPHDTSTLWIGILVVFYGMCVAGYAGLIHALVVELSTPQMTGVLSGLNFGFSSFSTATMPFLFSLFIEATNHYRIGWTLSASSALLAIFLLNRLQDTLTMEEK